MEESDEWQVTGDERGQSNIKRPTSNLLWRILDLLVGGIFIYAGALKALDPVRFAHDIDNYKILPWTLAAGLAFYLPWLEILCGVALVVRRAYVGGLSVLTALTLIFIVATIAAKMRGLDITCGCFGHASVHWSFAQHMAVDLGILVALFLLWFFRVTSRDRDIASKSYDQEN